MTSSVWSVMAASVAGSAHDKHNTPCQDSYTYRVLPDGTLIIAVADGAGSASRADEGAQVVTHEAITLLEATLEQHSPDSSVTWEHTITSIFHQVYQILEAMAHACNEEVRAFATTLTLVVVRKPWLVIGQIGDGFVVVTDRTGSLHMPVQPERGEYANETSFLRSDSMARGGQCYAVIRPVSAVAVSTDGLIRLALQLPTYQPFERFFRPLFDLASEMQDQAQANNDLAVWLESDAVCARADDDKTLVIATCIETSSTSTVG